MNNTIKSCIRKALFSITTGLVVIFLLSAAYFFYSFSQETFEIRLEYSEAGESIENFFSMKLPSSSGDLFYFSDGFMDPVYYIGMTIEPAEAWKFIKKFSGKTKRDFKQLKAANRYDRYMEGEALWDLRAMRNPMSYTEEKGEGTNRSVKFICYDEETQRLLVYLILY